MIHVKAIPVTVNASCIVPINIDTEIDTVEPVVIIGERQSQDTYNCIRVSCSVISLSVASILITTLIFMTLYGI